MEPVTEALEEERVSGSSALSIFLQGRGTNLSLEQRWKMNAPRYGGQGRVGFAFHSPTGETPLSLPAILDTMLTSAQKSSVKTKIPESQPGAGSCFGEE